MPFRTTVVQADGESYTLRELSGGAVRKVQKIEDDLDQGYILVGLSLCDSEGNPKYSIDQIDQALAEIDELPKRIIEQILIPAATALNDGDMDGARGN